MEPFSNALANVNGKLIPLAEAHVSVLDRGFLFGDAVYEVIRVYQGMPFLFAEHLERLRQSLDAISIRSVNLDRLRDRVLETIHAISFREATVYIQITRGSAPRSHVFPADAVPFEFLYVDEFKDPYREARANGCKVLTLPEIRWARCHIKSTNLLANVLSLQTAWDAGCKEAVFYLPDGTLTEGTHSSLFGVLGGAVVTTPKADNILPGITRGFILDLAKHADIPVREDHLNRNNLEGVTELFLSGTSSEVLPVVSIDARVVGAGHPGPTTRKIQEAYVAAVRTFLETAN